MRPYNTSSERLRASNALNNHRLLFTNESRMIGMSDPYTSNAMRALHGVTNLARAIFFLTFGRTEHV